ncbi:MAG: lytic transglycosylase domain-containing protein [Bdellovibrionales bacterium]|nr:lytic transglycosylase domain-containing protein [Bdellovibrionales bacterium]
MIKALVVLICNFPFIVSAAVDSSSIVTFKEIANELQKQRLERAQKNRQKKSDSYIYRQQQPFQPRVQSYKSSTYSPIDSKPIFDIPVTYNKEVKKWIYFYQNDGRKWLKSRLERSNKYLPIMQQSLADRGLPQDLAYIALIESGFSAHAVSTAEAVGYWQFIEATAKRYKLQINWWIDERRDFVKSTQAAANYLGDLYKMFNSWYLTATAYNMGENRLKRLINKHQTRDFWELSSKDDFPDETKNYIPKMLAALLISKAPRLYGFKDLKPMKPYRYDYMFVPGGTDLHNLASYIGVSKKQLTKLNPELKMGFIPGFVNSHRIRVPKGYQKIVSKFIRNRL